MVATPIGNLDDITLRALKVLAEVEIVAAEDTRNTAALLARHAIAKRPVALHEHNEARMAAQVLAWLREGRSVALVSDAGTPGLSDPGALVVGKAMAAGMRVVPIPGANAAVAAFSASGLADGRFVTCEKGLPRVKIYSASGEFESVVAGVETFAANARACGPSDCTAGGLDAVVDSQGRIVVLDFVTGDVRVMKAKT